MKNLWIARDQDGDLLLFDKKPKINGMCNSLWSFSSKGLSVKLRTGWFKNITFENSPQKIELKLVTSKNFNSN